MRGATADGEAILRLRADQGLTQEALAAAAVVDVKTVRRAEQGDRVDVRTLDKIAAALGVPTRVLIGRESDDASSRVERHIGRFHAWQEAHNRRDVEGLLAQYHPEGVIVIPGGEGVPGGGEFHGLDPIRRHFTESFAVFDVKPLGPGDYRIDGVGDLVWARGVGTATVRATGMTFSAMAVHELEFREGLIWRHTIVTDTASIRDRMSGSPPT